MKGQTNRSIIDRHIQQTLRNNMTDVERDKEGDESRPLLPDPLPNPPLEGEGVCVSHRRQRLFQVGFDAPAAPTEFLTGLFFLSGFAGLVYQVCWQRVLFAAFGSDLESVTIVVAAFMLGLGGGSLAGGWLSDRFPAQTLGLFCVCEFGIGAYGMVSYDLMRWVGDVFILSSLPVIAATNFLLVLSPALLMGATLPILVAHVVRRWGNVGKATGHLYGANTLGAAFGALAAVFLLFPRFDLGESIGFGVALNFLVATLAFVRIRVAR